MASRVCYAGQEVKIVNADSTFTKYLPVQSANCDVTIPKEDVLAFGRLGSLGRFQNAVATCKADIKTYLHYNTGQAAANQINAAFLNKLTGESLSGTLSVITVSPNGFTMSGILSAFNVEATNGSFAMADFSFVGVGEPVFAAAPSTSSITEQSNMPASFTPVLSANIVGLAATGCTNSFRFSLDIPNETLNCLGGTVSGSQVAVSSSYLQVAKPPFKTTINAEGTAVDAPSSALAKSQFQIGKLGITLPAAEITSRAYNQAVGQVGASFSYTIEDVSCNFADVS